MLNNEIIFDLVRKQEWDDIVEMLKKHDNIDVNIRDDNNNYLITYAILFNKIDIISLLIHKGSRLDITDDDGRSIIYLAIKYNYIEILDLLLHFNDTHIGISLVDIRDNKGNIPLQYAIASKNLDIIKKLLKAGSDVNFINTEGYNALHLAIFTRNIDICKQIINYNVNINTKTITGETALHIACNLETINIAEYLLNKSIDLNIQDYDNEYTALIYSVNRNNKKLVKLLLDNKANVNLQDYNGNTALHYSVIEDNQDIFNILMTSEISKNIINVNLFNSDSKIPLHLAFNNKSVKFYIDKLLSYSKVNFQDDMGNTTLHYIIKNDIWKTYTDILETKKLDIFIKNVYKMRPVDYVRENDYKEFINLTANSYLYILRNSPYTWKSEWENMCRRDLFSNTITNDEFKKLNKLVILNANEKEDVCKKIIVKRILDTITKKQKYPSYPYKTNRVQINIQNKPEISFCTFTGVTLDILLGIIHVVKKYKNVCSTITKNFVYNPNLCEYYKKIGVVSLSRCDFLNFEIVWVHFKLYLSDKFTEQFEKCKLNKKYRFIIIPLGIELQEGSHANMLIYDKTTNELERFEPHGSNHPNKFNYNPMLLDNILQSRFEEIDKNIKYFKPADYLPKIGFQIFDLNENTCIKIGDPKGFCVLWSIWYSDMRIQYSDLPRDVLILKIIRTMKENNISFKNMIRDYSLNVIELRDSILVKSNLNINDWINDKYSEKQMNQVIEQIKLLID